MPHYYMFHKPKGCVTAKKDSLSKTVMDYFPKDLRDSLHPSGRLDKDTEGFLLITDDGALTYSLMHPDKHVSKTYFFYAIGVLTEEKIKAVSEGLTMRGSNTPVRPARIKCLSQGVITEIADFLPENKREQFLKYPAQKIFSGEITIEEGKNHQVKRMLRAIDCCIVYLKRINIGGVSLDESLAPGEYRELTYEELAKLKR
ncbi:MAG: pseudouridine synthase [Oscillospiraceae bacterium]|nr:pseudouridine synthase [Oscillospiraceae bacterium]MDY6207734.1 pseudouridine synthase [Oscillospiraceae bacterium]